METNNFGNNYTMEDIKKKFKNSMIIASLLILAGFILSIVLAVSMVGEDGYIRDDAPGEWLFVGLIPIILGSIMLFVPMISATKLAKSNINFVNPVGLSPEESKKNFEQILNPLKKAKIITIIIAVLFFGVLFVLTIMGKLSWAELIDSLF